MLPRCTACQRAGTNCEQEDRNRNTIVLRSTIDDLLRKLSACEALIKLHVPHFDLKSLDLSPELPVATATAADPFVNVHSLHFPGHPSESSASHSPPLPVPRIVFHSLLTPPVARPLTPQAENLDFVVGSAYPEHPRTSYPYNIPLVDPLMHHQSSGLQAIDPRSNDLSNIKVGVSVHCSSYNAT